MKRSEALDYRDTEAAIGTVALEVSKPLATCLGVYLGIFDRLGRFRVQQYFINDWKPEGLVVRL